jgi:beta-aspartyl-peptidase (threonine type)
MKEVTPKAIVIHGGAGKVDMSDLEDSRNLHAKTLALKKIVQSGWDELSKNSSALDVATNTIVLLENDEPFNAGYGSSIGFDENGDPLVSLDASIMLQTDGMYKFGGVTGIMCMRNPILVARAVLNQRANLLHGDGANALAREVAKQNLLPISENRDLMTEYKLRKFEAYKEANTPESREGGTVGVVVFDGTTIVAATSTGGITGKAFGRTGDSCIPGAGTYADSYGGSSATGFGESIMLQGSAKKAVELLNEHYSPQEAAQIVTDELRDSFEGKGGIILVDKYGEIGIATNTEHMPNAFMTDRMDAPVVKIN